MVGVVKGFISHQTWLLLKPKRGFQLRRDGGYSLKNHLELTMGVLFWRAEEGGLWENKAGCIKRTV